MTDKTEFLIQYKLIHCNIIYFGSEDLDWNQLLEDLTSSFSKLFIAHFWSIRERLKRLRSNWYLQVFRLSSVKRPTLIVKIFGVRLFYHVMCVFNLDFKLFLINYIIIILISMKSINRMSFLCTINKWFIWQDIYSISLKLLLSHVLSKILFNSVMGGEIKVKFGDNFS